MAPTEREPSNRAARSPQDPYGQQLKTLTSAVQRLRGWTGSDPSRRSELVDALLALNAHRLLGHLHIAAAVDTQETVRLAVEVMLASGPVGPYTRVEDADRCGRSMIQLAAVQVGLGLTDSAGRSLESWNELRRQVAAVGVRPELDAMSVGWALGSAARVALAGGALSPANAYADGMLVRLAESSLGQDADSARFGLLAVDADRLVSDCRWAGGLATDGLAFLHRAKDRYDRWVDGRLAQPGRYPPALVERLAEPLFGLYRDLADRLAEAGEVDLALGTRRDLVAALRLLTKRLEPARIELVSALTDLADELGLAERADEAQQAADEAVTLAEHPACPPGVRLLANAARARVFITTGRAEQVIESLGQTLTEESDAPPAASAVTLWALAEAVRATGDAEAAASMERQAAELVADPARLGGAVGARSLARGVTPLGPRPVGWAPLDEEAGYGRPEMVETASVAGRLSDALATERSAAHRIEEARRAEAQQGTRERRNAEAEAAREATEREAARRATAEEAAGREAAVRVATEESEQAERKQRREQRLTDHAHEVRARDEERRSTRRQEIDARIDELAASGPSDVEAREIERLAIERADLDQVTPAASELPRPEPEKRRPVRAPARPEPESERPEPVEGRPEPEPEGPRPEPVEDQPRAEPVVDAVDLARQAWQDARTAEDRRGTRTALEALVELLRPRVAADLQTWGPQLRTALEDLAGVRLRGGDLFGSRSASREAKAIGKTLSR